MAAYRRICLKCETWICGTWLCDTTLQGWKKHDMKTRGVRLYGTPSVAYVCPLPSRTAWVGKKEHQISPPTAWVEIKRWANQQSTSSIKAEHECCVRISLYDDIISTQPGDAKSRDSKLTVLVLALPLLSWTCVSRARQFKTPGYWQDALLMTHCYYPLAITVDARLQRLFQLIRLQLWLCQSQLLFNILWVNEIQTDNHLSTMPPWSWTTMEDSFKSSDYVTNILISW